MVDLLSSDEIDLLRTSFREISKSREDAAARFYDRLFEIAPETRSLFGGDMIEQRAKMMSTLGSIVAQIHAFEALAPMVSDLARRHVTYRVEPGHYALVGEALIGAIKETLGPRFTPDVESVWCRAYAALSQAMIAAGYAPENGNASS